MKRRGEEEDRVRVKMREKERGARERVCVCAGTRCLVSVSMGTAWDFWTITGSKGICLVTDAHTRTYICAWIHTHTHNKVWSYSFTLASSSQQPSI